LTSNKGAAADRPREFRLFSLQRLSPASRQQSDVFGPTPRRAALFPMRDLR